MKYYILIILLVAGIVGCGKEYLKTYQLTYYNGDKENITIKVIEGNYCYLNGGDFIYSSRPAIRSGVRMYRLLSIDTIKTK